MFCADRCVISSLGEAVDLALVFPADAVGVVVDTYHVWWDARLAARSPGPGGGSSASRCATGCCRCLPTPCLAGVTSATG